MVRPDSDHYFMAIAHAAKLRSTCPRASVGAVLVDATRHVVATGYNGSPPGMAHCEDVGCCIEVGIDGAEHCISTVHAEMNCIVHAISPGETLYTTHEPCLECFKALVAFGVKRVIFDDRYDDPRRDRFVEWAVNNGGLESFRFFRLIEGG